MLALRVRDVPGARIGEVLAEVEEFCADSGLDARAAFGDPAAYAESLTTSTGEDRPGLREDLGSVSRALPGFLGLVLVLACLVEDGPDLPLTAGWLLGLPLMLGASVVVVRAVGRSTSAGWRRLVAPAAVVATTLALVVALGLLLTVPVATVPDVVALPLGALLLVGDAVAGTVRARRRPTADVVSAPGEDPAQVRRRNVRADVLAAWMLPGFTVVGVAFLLGTDALLP